MSLTEMLHCRFTISCHCLSLTVFSFSIFLACAAWRFWLGALNNKGGRGQRIHEEIGAGATWKTACTDRGAFLSWSVRQRMDHCDWFRMFTRQSNILVISHGRISRDWTKHLHKTKSKYQRSVDQSIVDLEYLMAKQGNIVLKPKQEMAIYSLLQRRDVMAILSPGFGKSMIFTVFAMAKEEMSSSKTCMLPISPLKSTIDNQILEMLLLGCTAMELTKMYDRNSQFASRKSTSIFSIIYLAVIKSFRL